jgi:hypothetical protein
MARRSFRTWLRQTDAVMSGIYGIDTSDAGVDDEFMKRVWKTGETPREFVEWFGQKFDLVSKREVGLAGWR